MAGIRSIALSQVYAREGIGEAVSFAPAEAWGERALRPLIDAPFPPGMLVNINFPALPPEQVKGIRIASQSIRDYGRTSFTSGTDPRGFPYYWLRLGPAIGTPGQETDLEAIDDGFVSITPLHLDLTHRAAIDALRVLY